MLFANGGLVSITLIRPLASTSTSMYQILLVDDDHDVSSVIQDYIHKTLPLAEFNKVDNGQLGLEALAKQSYDCILLDYQLPDMNGLHFIQKYKSDENADDTAVIMLTGAGTEIVAVNALKNGFTDYLIKKDLSAKILQQTVIKSIDLVNEKKQARLTKLALIESEARYRDLFDNANDLIQSIDSDGLINYVNQAWCDSLGYTQDELKKRSIFELIHPDDLSHCENIFTRLKAGDNVDNVEVRYLTKDKRKLILEGSINCQFLDGKIHLTRGIFRDITSRRHAEQELQKEKQRLQVTLNSIGDAVISTDTNGQIEFMNPIAETLTGWLYSQVQGKPLSEVFNIINKETNAPITNPVSECLKQNKIIGVPENTVLVNRYGKKYNIKDSAAPIRTEKGELIGAVMVFQDITEALVMAEELNYHSSYDALTGLLNRQEFEQHLETALQSANNKFVSHVLLVINMDNFKIINDTAGNVAGDALLKQISNLLNSRLRTSDIAARVGGDEFGIILESCSIEKAQSIAKDIISTVRNLRFSWNKQVYELGLCIGLVPIIGDTETVSELLSHADLACREAKERGRNQSVTYYKNDTDNALIRRHQDLIRAASLHDAIENNKLSLYTQAIKDYENNIVIYELLLRMKGDDGELILPNTFIPAAERFKLMGEIDRWVIKTALIQYAEIFGINSNEKISINLSGNSLADNDLLGFILSHIASSGIKTGNIGFEITETAAITNLAEATRLITALKSHGCFIALDDFGSGMSSFNYLKQFPIDYIKIDGSFMQSIVINPVDYAMVESINHVGQVMGIKTIAEWVEDDKTKAKLNSIGIDYIQGYAVDRPKPFIDLST